MVWTERSWTSNSLQYSNEAFATEEGQNAVVINVLGRKGLVTEVGVFARKRRNEITVNIMFLKKCGATSHDCTCL